MYQCLNLIWEIQGMIKAFCQEMVLQLTQIMPKYCRHSNLIFKLNNHLIGTIKMSSHLMNFILKVLTLCKVVYLKSTFHITRVWAVSCLKNLKTSPILASTITKILHSPLSPTQLIKSSKVNLSLSEAPCMITSSQLIIIRRSLVRLLRIRNKIGS